MTAQTGMKDMVTKNPYIEKIKTFPVEVLEALVVSTVERLYASGAKKVYFDTTVDPVQIAIGGPFVGWGINMAMVLDELYRRKEDGKLTKTIRIPGKW